MLEIVSATVPVLVTVIVCAELERPVTVLANVNVVADSPSTALVIGHATVQPPVLPDTPDPQPLTDSRPDTRQNIAATATRGLDDSDTGNRNTEGTSQLQAASF